MTRKSVKKPIRPKTARTNPKGLEDKKKNLRLLLTFVRDLSFECVAPVLKPLTKGEQQLDFRLSVGARKIAEVGGVEQAEVTLHLRAVATRKSGAPIFVSEMAYSGLVEWENSCEVSSEEVVWELGPRLIYPQARKAISSVLAENGFFPPLPESIDFAALKKHVK